MPETDTMTELTIDLFKTLRDQNPMTVFTDSVALIVGNLKEIHKQNSTIYNANRTITVFADESRTLLAVIRSEKTDEQNIDEAPVWLDFIDLSNPGRNGVIMNHANKYGKPTVDFYTSEVENEEALRKKLRLHM